MKLYMEIIDHKRATLTAKNDCLSIAKIAVN